MSSVTIDTPHGPARAELELATQPCAALVLGHGAGGGIAARDLQAARNAALAVSVSVALVEQPYRVAGRRSPAPAHHLDASWIAVVQTLMGAALDGLPVVIGGRSSGARVACRTAEAIGPVGVVCLAFPLRPPRRSGSAPAPDRLPELDALRVPTLIVQGERDPFGMPPAKAGRTVVSVAGDHSLRTAVGAVTDAVSGWLASILVPA